LSLAQRFAADADSEAGARLLAELAAIEHERDDDAGAIARERRQLALSERLFGESDARTLSALEQLARALWSAEGREEARALLTRAHAIRSESLGPEHPDTVAAELALARRLRRADPTAAQCHCEQVIAIRRRTLGDRDRATLDAIRLLAGILSDRGWEHADEPEARQWLTTARAVATEAVAGERELGGGLATATVDAIALLAVIEQDLGDHAAAQRLTAEVERAATDTWGTDAEQAFAHARRLIWVSRRVEGAHDPATLARIASMLERALARGLQAEPPWREWLQKRASELAEARRAALGADHPDTVAAAKTASQLGSEW